MSMTKKFVVATLLLVLLSALGAIVPVGGAAQTDSETLKLGAGFDINTPLTYLRGTAEIPFSNGNLNPSIGLSMFTEGNYTETLSSGLCLSGEAVYYPYKWRLQLGNFSISLGAGARVSLVSVSNTSNMNEEFSFTKLDAVMKLSKTFYVESLNLEIWSEAGARLNIGKTSLQPTFGFGIWF